MKHAKGFSEKKIIEGAPNTLDIGYSSRVIKQRNESLENMKNLRDGQGDHDNCQTIVHIYFKKLQFNFNFKLNYKVY